MKALAAVLLALLWCGQQGTWGEGWPCSEKDGPVQATDPQGHPTQGQDVAWGGGQGAPAGRGQREAGGLSWVHTGPQTCSPGPSQRPGCQRSSPPNPTQSQPLRLGGARHLGAGVWGCEGPAPNP